MTLGVALCERAPVKRLFGEACAAHGLTLLDPGEVEDPRAVRFALSFEPAGDAFAPYPNLVLAASIGAGAEAILRAPSLPPHVPVVRVRDADQADQMAAFALFHIVYWHRRFDQLFAAAQAGTWARANGGRSPRDKTVGVLGYGVMGARIAAAAASLGYHVRAYTRRPRAPEGSITFYHGDGLKTFLAGTDFLVAVLPTTAETDGMIDGAFLRGLPRGAVLIQLGRGGQVVEADLIAALDEGHLTGASLDVFAAEPLPPNDPLWRHPKVVATPHTASEATADVVAQMVAKSLESLAQGLRPADAVDRAMGY